MTDADLRSRFGSLSADQVAALDRAAGEAGVAVDELMEMAGRQVARCAWRELHERPARVLVVAGHGNNGGDALVAARHLATLGCDVHVHRVAVDDAAALRGLTASATLIIDGILGTGLRAAPRAPQAAVIRTINESGVPVLAIDIPSGMDASTGEPYEPCVRAAVTCTLAAVKAGLWSPAARALAGRIVVADIGMPAAAWLACSLPQPPAVGGGEIVELPPP